VQDDVIDEGFWLVDVAPNLLLIEHTAGELRVELEKRAPDRERAHLEGLLADLVRMLEPRFAGLGPARPILADLIARGQAPSPWRTELLEAANT
jgi:hypothetical protein